MTGRAVTRKTSKTDSGGAIDMTVTLSRLSDHGNEIEGVQTITTLEPVSAGLVAATVAGNALEFYDFVTYAFFAVYIGKAFFPAATPFTSLLLSVGVFGVGFVSRPLGGVLIGRYADRAGRKPAMLLTIGLITLGTLGLAVTPSFAQIGPMAPAIVTLCRLVQGLALGGEVGPSTAFLIELAPKHRRGYYASWQFASQGIAMFAAGLVGVALTGSLTSAELETWGWRVPFALGLLLLPLALYLRRRMPETLVQPLAQMTARSGAPAAERPRLWDHSRLIVLSVLVILGATVSTYIGTYMTSYAITTLKLPPTIAMTATVVVGIVTFAFSLLGGWLCDRVGRKPVMLIPRILLVLVTYPAFLILIELKTATALFAVTAILASLTALTTAGSLVALPELFPKSLRATGLSIGYAVGVSVFGGTTQFIVTWLIGTTGNAAAPAWYVTIASVVTALAMFALPESRNREVHD